MFTRALLYKYNEVITSQDFNSRVVYNSLTVEEIFIICPYFTQQEWCEGVKGYKDSTLSSQKDEF